jgi:hypothetical protein
MESMSFAPRRAAFSTGPFNFFHKQVAVVVTHGVIKESNVPDRDIDLAIRRKAQFEANPSKHTLEENENAGNRKNDD